MPKQPLTDSLIIEGILSGGRAESIAIGALYDQNKAFFLKLLKDSLRLEKSKEPEDIIWEAIEAFVWNVKDGKYQTQENIPIAMYVRAIAKNLLLKYLSSENARSTRQSTYMEEVDESIGDASQSIIEKEKWERYLQIFENAGKNCKRILQMVYGLGYSVNEMAKELIEEGIFENEQVVRNAKSKCLKKVMLQLQ